MYVQYAQPKPMETLVKWGCGREGVQNTEKSYGEFEKYKS